MTATAGGPPPGAANRGAAGHRITVWGAPSTGKTTFLAALNVALDRQDEPWRLIGADEASADALTNFERALVKDRLFPEATRGTELYRWELIGAVQRPARRRWLGPRMSEETVTIPLEVVDAPGGAADPSTSGPALSRALLENIEQSKGILFFFDPVRELETGDAFAHAHALINTVLQRMGGRRLPDGRLPHHVAICVTKFDELRLVEVARTLGMLDVDDRGIPRVPGTDAREFVCKLCGYFGNRDAELMLNRLERNFRRDRINYFVTSAIGFYLDPRTGRCDMEDFQNHVPASERRTAQIRGDVFPVNVAEPVLWLAQS